MWLAAVGSGARTRKATKIFFEDFAEAEAWLRENRGAERQAGSDALLAAPKTRSPARL
jgi:hypothetical protein